MIKSNRKKKQKRKKNKWLMNIRMRFSKRKSIQQEKQEMMKYKFQK